MAILKFSASAVAAQIAHARACKTFLPNWNGPVDRPALILIVGNGVHLRSNGIDGTTTRIVTTEQADPSFAFADGMNPFRDADWMAQRRMAFRDLTGQFYTDILDDVQVLIDRGQGAIRLATDGHSIRVFVRRAADYLIGGTYEVPSGLGGTFRVILKDACDTFAIVQNCGNCEDFDAMQPYRVPLDALMEIDDQEGGVPIWVWLFYTDGLALLRRVQTYADEKAEIARLCTFEGDTRKTELVKACKVGSTWYAAARVTTVSTAPLSRTRPMSPILTARSLSGLSSSPDTMTGAGATRTWRKALARTSLVLPLG